MTAERGVLAIDAGNSKTDVAIVAADGTVLGHGPRRRVPAARRRSRGGGGRTRRRWSPRPRRRRDWRGRRVRLVAHVSACLANADLPVEERRSSAAIDARGWGRVERGRQRHVRAAARRRRRAARASPWSAARASTASGVLPDGRTARFPAVGRISGDWGGGGYLWQEAMWWAARAEDGRGDDDRSCAPRCPRHFGLSRCTR